MLVVLAIGGHSARDTFRRLTTTKVSHIEAKPFPLGVRIEAHPQSRSSTKPRFRDPRPVTPDPGRRPDYEALARMLQRDGRSTASACVLRGTVVAATVGTRAG